jgi:hypothetical protein
MQTNTALIVTSISAPNNVLRSLTDGARQKEIPFIVIGDVKSPSDFYLDGCDFYSIERQKKTGLRLADLCPEKHYARKNIGYLLAIQNGATLIIETDDDNFPREGFLAKRTRKHLVPLAENKGWLNVFRLFTDNFIWPRGYPIEIVQRDEIAIETLPVKEVLCPVQQGLADENPDVDAVYRLIYPLPLSFEKNVEIALGKGSWCPFNSQNTAWFSEVFPLLYLPAYCSFRMTDIWRSFVAQRIMWENGWHLLFHWPTVWQERNEHNLLKDFQDEIPGYLNNDRIVKTLEDLNLSPGKENLGENLMRCYKTLVNMDLVGREELKLVDVWLEDLRRVQG